MSRARQQWLEFASDYVPGNVRDDDEATAQDVSEAQVQASVLGFLKRHPRVAWVYRINVAAGRLARPDGKGGYRLSQFMRFAFPGCSDNIGQTTDGRFLAVETKPEGEEAKPHQAAFLALVNKHGGLGFVARGIDDVLRYLPLEGSNAQ